MSRFGCKADADNVMEETKCVPASGQTLCPCKGRGHRTQAVRWHMREHWLYSD